ncbi:MAG: LptA/OstA family protein [Opitutaceae bacterium]
MTPNAPVKDFRLPRFGDNGYTQWVLQGGKGIYDSPEQVRIEDMGLRVYTGDERMAVEMTMDSPEATVLVTEHRAVSESTIEIVGANFKISGVGWTWDGKTKEIEVLYDTVVEFTQDISGTLSGELATDTDGDAPKTTILSERLKLTTTEAEYQFDFINRVVVESGDMLLRSNALVVKVDAPEGRKEGAPKVETDKLDSVREIRATGDVVIDQAGRIVRAGEAEFFPREKQVHLSGTPQIEASGAYLSGHTIRTQKGEIIVEGGGDSGRAQMILTDTGGLGIQGGGALGAETIVLSNTITMRELEKENRFTFAGSTEVMSGAVHMRSETMEIFADKDAEKPKKAEAVAAEAESDINVGDVRKMVAKGGVRIEQNNQVVTSQMVTFYPNEERAVLEGDPKVTNGEAVLTGEKVELKPGLAIVTGSAAKQVNVLLPEMDDMGYAAFGGVATASSPKSVEPTEKELTPTIVRSNMLRMVEEADQTLFRFTDNVSIVGTNLEASCERLDVIAKESAAVKDAPKSDVSQSLELERIEAYTAVEVKQDNRIATADRGLILPKEGKVILEGNAVVNDDRGRVSGHRMILLQGQRRAIVEGGGPEGERAKITLPEFPSR